MPVAAKPRKWFPGMNDGAPPNRGMKTYPVGTPTCLTDAKGARKLIYMDEVGTPDSSRIWDGAAYSEGKVVENSKEGFRKMLQERLSVTLCTDNRLVSRTTVTAEYEKAVEAFKIGPGPLAHLLVYGFKRSFFPGSYREKRAYVRQVLDFRDAVFARHGFSVA